MKAYLFYSKDIIRVINNPSLIKKQIAILLTEMFNKFNDIQSKDIMIVAANIPNGYDVFFIIDEKIDEELKTKILEVAKKIKNYILSILREDQDTAYDYKIMIKIEPGYLPDRPAIKKTSALHNRETMENNISKQNQEFDYEQRIKLFIPKEPNYSFDSVFLPENVQRKIEESLATIEYEGKVFNEWGLYEIQPYPASALNFFGPPGTGKSMTAEAIAQKVGKKILRVTYADVESKYHGEGPKMVKAIFMAAERTNSVLFFDEADSLLSKRLTNTNDGTAQAINSMRSQLTTCLDSFKGIVIFATNLIVNYDRAFLTRLISVEFQRPDVETRIKIWNRHIKAPNDGTPHRLNIPLSEDVDTLVLAQKYDFVGREIRNAVISACVKAAMKKNNFVCQADFINSCEQIISERGSVENAKDHTLNDMAKRAIVKTLVEKSKEEKENVSKIVK